MERGLPTPPEASEFRPEKLNGEFKGKDIYSGDQFDLKSFNIISELIPQMEYIAKNAIDSRILGGTMTALLFYEASTRTKLSFDTGIKQLGGQTTTEYTQALSEAKGESFEGTIKNIEAYCDAIVLRHPEASAIQIAMDTAKHVPIINGGNGPNQHPTQVLGDLFTMKKHKGRIEGLRGLVARDILNSRTAHSFFDEMAIFPNNTIYTIAPEELQIQESDIEKYRKRGLTIIKLNEESDIPRDLDYHYINRVQKARLKNPERDFDRFDSQTIVDDDYLDKYGNDKLIVFHAQPIGREITREVQKDPHMVLDDQVRYCQYARMALMALVFGRKNPNVIEYHI
ncbi:MAG: Aspartate carbamoyltransferase [Candidatus Levybacteria bacterium GW2011_GWA1_37_16]|nr:MAG: Aspartate carbamoyltransferase [Candidatus Levybacteria bacterium GW2011_GWA1_37_16]